MKQNQTSPQSQEKQQASQRHLKFEFSSATQSPFRHLMPKSLNMLTLIKISSSVDMPMAASDLAWASSCTRLSTSTTSFDHPCNVPRLTVLLTSRPACCLPPSSHAACAPRTSFSTCSSTSTLTDLHIGTSARLQKQKTRPLACTLPCTLNSPHLQAKAVTYFF